MEAGGGLGLRLREHRVAFHSPFYCSEKFADFQADGFRDERRDGVADDSELMRAGDRELKPVREALDAGGFAGG